MSEGLMVNNKGFNTEIADSQGTVIKPIAPEKFDIDKYADYEVALLERNEQFWKSDSGVLVYRRFRVPEVFSYSCKDMELSLSLQLAVLEKSMDYKADIANFLEPWYGIGTIATAFGADYHWPDGQAPVSKHLFNNVKEALDCETVPVAETSIGKHTLDIIEYFLDKTKGKIPISLTDTQSPLNIASGLVEMNNFFMALFDDPDGVRKLIERTAKLSIEFNRKQLELIGDALAKPGHGFASSRAFDGVGMSDDMLLMISEDDHAKFIAPFMADIGKDFGGAVFHSCGNWTAKIDGIKAIDNLLMVDGAFTAETDPSPNPVGPVVEAFASTGVVINARMVGNVDVVMEKLKEFNKPGVKLIAVTYCQTPEEQSRAYNLIRSLDGRQ